MTTPKVPRLPRCCAKYDLITYFGCSYRYLWSRILPEPFLNENGYSYQDIKGAKFLPPDLTLAIYARYQITDLDLSLTDQLRQG